MSYFLSNSQLAKSLEDLGGGLRMVDFEQLRAERQSLCDKIEERNNELARLRLRCNADTQILAHVREKDHMLDNRIGSELEQLVMYSEEMSTCRNFVNQRKGERDQIRRNFSELSHSVGLLDKPSLLLDFDQIEKQISERKRDIDRIKSNTNTLLDRIKMNTIRLNDDGPSKKHE